MLIILKGVCNQNVLLNFKTAKFTVTSVLSKLVSRKAMSRYLFTSLCVHATTA